MIPTISIPRSLPNEKRKFTYLCTDQVYSKSVTVTIYQQSGLSHPDFWAVLQFHPAFIPDGEFFVSSQ